MSRMQKQTITRRTMLQGMGTALGAGLTVPMLHPAPVAAVVKEEVAGPTVRIPAWYYQHFDADYEKKVPEEGFGGWKKQDLDFSLDHTAVVVMHAWNAGTREAYPGWWRCVPYIPRSYAILEKVFPELLSTVRNAGLTLFHVVGGGEYYKKFPGYQRAVALAGPPEPAPEKITLDPVRQQLEQFRSDNVFVGKQNQADVKRGFDRLDFAPQAKPVGEEGIAENGRQLFALCKERCINHLVYCGFAINWCLLLSPGGMAEMQKYGILCSALRQATTAVENKESAKKEWAKELALWRVALAFGFVFDVDDFSRAVKKWRA